jgi:LEA14-like dessication related protein
MAERLFKQPEVRVTGVRMEGIGLRGGRIDVLLQVYNPNPYGLDLSHVSYTLHAGDSIDVGRGASEAAIRIGARDSAHVSLPVDVTWAGLQAAGVRELGSGRVRYGVTGDFTVATPLGSFTRPYVVQGRR